MTANQLRRGRLAVGLAILTTAGLLFLALWAVGPQLLQDVGASYGQRVYAPERLEYCPGDALTFSYTVAPRTAGPIEIVSSWRNATRRTSLLDETKIQHANIIEAVPAISASLTITIPVSAQMLPGSEWQFVRSVRRLGTARFDMFIVPFKIAEGCD